MKNVAYHMPKEPLIKFTTIKNIVATLYYQEGNELSLIYAKGAPGPWDNGSSDYLELCRKYNINIIVPDYLGYGRSNGNLFDIKNCAETLTICKDFFEGKISGKIFPDNKNLRLKSNAIIVVGSSFGGSIVPLLKKFNPSINKTIKHIGLLSPLTDWRTQSSNKEIPEESMTEFDNLMSNVLMNIYRGYKKSKLFKLVNKDPKVLNELNPSDNIDLLQGFHVYIAHGSKDKSINWKKSKYFYDLLRTANQNTKFKLLKNIGHGGSIKRVGLSWIIEEFKKDVQK